MGYNLFDINPKNYFQAIFDLASQKDRGKDLEEALKALVQDPYGVSERAEYLEQDSVAIPPNDILIGALGFFLFVYYADKAEPDFEKANKRLEMPQVLQYFIDHYGIRDNIKGLRFSLHKVGTTSFILKVGPDRALKIIKPRFENSQTIMSGIRNYHKQFDYFKGNTTHSPKLYSLPGASYLLMEFVSWPTLREYITSDKWPKDELAILIEAQKITKELCWILKEYSYYGIHHLDLSWDNVFVERHLGFDDIHLHLIDFGINHIVRETVPLTQNAGRARRTIAPEVLKGSPLEDPDLADIYSIGLMVTGAFDLSKLEQDGTDDAMRKIHSEYPSVNKVLKQALEETPRDRLYQRDEEQNPFDYLVESLNFSVFYYKEVKYKNQKQPIPKLFQIMMLLFFPEPTVLWLLYRSYRFFKKIKSQYKNPPFGRLLIFATATQMCLIINIAAIGFVLVKHWHPITLETVAGWLVAITASWVAAKVYLGDFGMISTSGLSSATEFWMRVTSFWFVFPSLYVIMVAPTAWGFPLAIGILPPVAASWFIYRLGRIANKRMIDVYKRASPKYLEDSLVDLLGRFRNNAAYLLTVIIVATLNQIGLVSELWIWAVPAIGTHYLNYMLSLEKNAQLARYGIDVFLQELGKLT